MGKLAFCINKVSKGFEASLTTQIREDEIKQNIHISVQGLRKEVDELANLYSITLR